MVGGGESLVKCAALLAARHQGAMRRSFGTQNRWITPTDLGKLEDVFITTSARKITKNGYENCGTGLVPVGSVVLSSRAPIGHLGIASVPLCTNQGCKTFVPSAAVDSNFLFYALKISVSKLQALGSGATFVEISKTELERFEIPLPPPAEQKRIAGILKEQMAAVERARASAEAQLQAAEHLPAAYLRAVFNNGEAQTWQRKQISELRASGVLVEHQDGNHGELHPRNKDFVASGVKFVTAKHVRDDGNVALEEAPHISKEQANGLRIGFGKSARCFSGAQCNSRAGWAGTRKLRAVHRRHFADNLPARTYATVAGISFFALRAEDFQKQLFDAMKQTTRNQVPITRQRDLKLPLPPPADQRRIAAQLSSQMASAERLRQMLTEQLDAINKLPAALLRRAFNGEL